ncbi:FMN-dependent NADH-azoreductase [Chelatococcus reniformis]|uniref:FMN dependent NADH:quinone oxidoreductase n=1 Tax=Chelatococcus reniformis TaxID=1494448 RepID=A0A916TW75_9HYPH|nr:NAD(P)H-dependent oxidoreductase [Chelatococcus reniformis]GGC45716.1 FMN-dependent NADH-azoreductase [Chelatococcus reniformis]
MSTVLHLDASARLTRSVSRALSERFVGAWRAARPGDAIVRRDLAVDPPPHVSEAWIAAAFSPPGARSAEMQAALAWSDAAIDELVAADVVVIGTPMYNYGMPSALKAWIDQVIRVGRTFSFDLARGDHPIRPILKGKRLVVLSARGEFGFAPGGARAALNHLDPHMAVCAPYLGAAADAVSTVTVEYQEFGDARHARSQADAEAQVMALVEAMATGAETRAA